MMSKERFLSYIVCFAVALMLTFGRTGFVPFAVPTTVDLVLNYFVVLVAPIMWLMLVIEHLNLDEFVAALLPILLLSAYIASCVLVNSSPELWPDFSTLLSIGLGVLLGSRIAVGQLRQLRLMVLLVGAFFSLVCLVYGRDSLAMIVRGQLTMRLGVDISPSLAVAYPRMLYAVVFTCYATALVEKSLVLRVGAIALIPLPFLMGLAAGGRGPLLALAVAAFAFTLTLRKSVGALIGAVLAAVLFFAGAHFIFEYLPAVAERIGNFDDDSNRIRYGIYMDAIGNVSLFGRGIGDVYAHNLFLELLQDYGVLGLALCIAVLWLSFTWMWRAFTSDGNTEALWFLGLMVMQLTAQQFSLNIFTEMFWATLAVPIGVRVSSRVLVHGPSRFGVQLEPAMKQGSRPNRNVGEDLPARKP